MKLQKEFEVASDLALVQKASTDVLSYLSPLKLSENDQFDIRLCLEEALINAMKYGHNLKKELPVRLSVEATNERLNIVVEDRGCGFDHSTLEDCTKEHNLLKNSGRGVFLIRKLMNEVIFNEKGNRVQMVKYLNSKS